MERTLAAHFPNAMTESDFVWRTHTELERFGFTTRNAICSVGVCRDELAQPLALRLAARWGEAFNCSSLGGMLFLGKTGIKAAVSHAPHNPDKIERHVFYAMPHIAIGDGGVLGRCRRSGRDESVACGALIAFQRELASGHLNLEMDGDDLELSLLKQRVFSRLRYGDVPDLVALTKLTHEVIQRDLIRLVELTLDCTICDYAVITGVQIHGPDDRNYVEPHMAYAMVRAEKHDFLDRLLRTS